MPGHSPAMSDRAASWGGVYAMALSTFVLVASEFMPVSLLSPIASDLHLSEGQAGQAISVCAGAALVASLTIARLFAGTDRRRLLMGLTSLMIASGVMIALAPSFAVLLGGRLLLGIGIGGFWSLSASIATRIVPSESATKALAVINSGPALATALAAPLASFAGSFIGWRGAFGCTVPLAIIAVALQAWSLPSLPTHQRQSEWGLLPLLRLPGVALGYLGVILFFGGQFALYTYLRPFLEQVTGANVGLVSTMLLIVGVAGFVGTMLVTRVIGDRLHLTIAVLSLVMAGTAFVLSLAGSTAIVAGALLALWGCVATGANVAWWSWVTRSSGSNAEAGGGLMVAAAQVGVSSGAAVGGIVFDALGSVVTFAGAAATLVLTAVAMLASGRRATAASTAQDGICVPSIVTAH